MRDITNVQLIPEPRDELDAVAEFDGLTVAAEIRATIELMVEQRHNNPHFKAHVKSALQRTQDRLTRIDGGYKVAEALGQGQIAYRASAENL